MATGVRTWRQSAIGVGLVEWVRCGDGAIGAVTGALMHSYVSGVVAGAGRKVSTGDATLQCSFTFVPPGDQCRCGALIVCLILSEIIETTLTAK